MLWNCDAARLPIGALLLINAFPALSHAASIRFENDVQVQFLKGNKTEKFKRDQLLQLDELEPLLIEAELASSVLIIPVASSDEITVRNPSLKETIASSAQIEASQLIDKVVSEISEIRALIQNRRISEADHRLKSAQSTYPKIQYFEFLRGSLAFLRGETKEAEIIIGEVMKIYPDNEEGKRFLQTIHKEAH